ncbi:hypothetical protein JYU02_00900 [bacterium AH-315-P15]|nr:hypothetical protein [bacterium AH-315-P15]
MEIETDIAERIMSQDAAGLVAFRDEMSKLIGPTSAVKEIVTFDFVVDANVVMRDILFRFKVPHLAMTRLQELVKSGVVTLHAPDWLIHEIENSAIPKAAKKKKFSIEPLMSIWKDYKSCIIFHSGFHPSLDLDTSKYDPKDWPYVALSETICANGVLSHDTDIEDLGGVRYDTQAMVEAQLYARAQKGILSMRVGGVLMGGVTLHGFTQLLQLLWEQFLKLPPKVRFILLTGLAAALIYPSTRKVVLSKLQSAADMSSPLWTIVEDLVKSHGELVRLSDGALEEIRPVVDTSSRAGSHHGGQS